MKKRGVLYLYWGENGGAPLVRSIKSLQEIHPELPYLAVQLPGTSTLLDKAAMFRHSPFEETLYLDTDTMVMDRLDFGFEMAVRHSLACCICECPWAKRYTGLANRGDMLEFNSGVIFFTRRAARVFDVWEQESRSLDSSIFMDDGKGGIGRMPCNDQAGFSVAISKFSTPPFVLPLNWNFRPAWHRSWWGPLKVWHDYSDPTPVVLEVQKQQLQPGALISYRQFS